MVGAGDSFSALRLLKLNFLDRHRVDGLKFKEWLTGGATGRDKLWRSRREKDTRWNGHDWNYPVSVEL